MSLKSILSDIGKFVSGIIKKLSKKVKDTVPFVIAIVNAIKEVNDGTTGDVIEFIITKVIPSDADDIFIRKLREKLKVSLPKIILALNLSHEIASIEDDNEKIKRLLTLVNFSNDDARKSFYHSWANLIIESLADSELTWSESIHIAEFYFKEFQKK